MKVLVCGSREWDDAATIRRELGRFGQDTTVIHGDVRGADRMAATIADDLGYRVERFPAHWRPGGRYNPMAGKERNIAMLAQHPDIVLAFQVNGSGGTQHTIDEAQRRGIRTVVFRR